MNQKDIRILEYNANVAHKIPVFAIQFLNTGEVWLMVKPSDFVDVAKFIKTGKCEKHEMIDLDGCEELEVSVSKKIKSSGSSRDEFFKEKEKRYDKTKKARKVKWEKEK